MHSLFVMLLRYAHNALAPALGPLGIRLNVSCKINVQIHISTSDAEWSSNMIHPMAEFVSFSTRVFRHWQCHMSNSTSIGDSIYTFFFLEIVKIFKINIAIS